MRSAALAVSLSLLVACRTVAGGEEPSPRRQVVAWVIGGAQSFESLEAHLDAIDVVSPAYYRVSFPPHGPPRLADWDPQNPVPRSTVRALTRARRVPVVPLVACLDECARRVSAILADPAARAAHARMLLQDSAADGAGGLFVDYEGVSCAPADFSAFVDALAEGLRARGGRLGVAVTEPCGYTPDCRRPGYPFDLAHLAATADYLAVMHYDFTIDGTTSVAPRGWVTRGLERVRAEAGGLRAKVFAGVPFYGRITKGLAADTAVMWGEVAAARVQGQVVRVLAKAFDPEKLAQVADIRYGPKALPGKIHYEDHESLQARLDLIAAQGFSSIAVWRLGGEDPCNWDVIRAWKRGARGACQPRPARVVAPLPGPSRVLAWLIGGAGPMRSLRAHAAAIDVLSPTYWRLELGGASPVLVEWDPGNPVRRAEVRAFASGRRVTVLPLVACAGACGERLGATLADPARRGALVRVLTTAVETEQSDGVFLDFHALRSAPADFTAFAAALAERLHGARKKLGVAVPEPCGAAPECARPAYSFELGPLAALADFLAVLHYDYAVDGSTSVAPRDWLVRGLRRVRAEVGDGRARVYVGVPTYGRLSAGLARDTAVLWEELRTGLVQGARLRLGRARFDRAKLAKVAEVRVSAKRGLVHFEDHVTMRERLAAIRGEGFANVAVWRLGGEDPCIWDAIRAWRSRSDKRPHSATCSHL